MTGSTKFGWTWRRTLAMKPSQRNFFFSVEPGKLANGGHSPSFAANRAGSEGDQGMIAKPRRARGNLWRIWPAPTALLTTMLLTLALVDRSSSADDLAAPTPEETARYLEWYRHQLSQNAAPAAEPTPEDIRFREWYKHNGAPLPAAAPASTSPTPVEAAGSVEEDKNNNTPQPPRTDAAPASVARFVDWYKHEGAPQPSGVPAPPPTRADVVRFLDWYKQHGAPVASEEAALTNNDAMRYLEAYQHSEALAPIGQAPGNEPAPAHGNATSFAESYLHSDKPAMSPMPVIAQIDVQPTDGRGVQTMVAQETPHALGVPAASLKEVEPQPNPAVVPSPLPPPAVAAPMLPATVAGLPPVQPPDAPAADQEPLTPFESVLQQVGCTSCGTGGGVLGFHAPVSGVPVTDLDDNGNAGCGCANCIPGRLNPGSTCEADTVLGRFLCELYQCICCPDPCYDPKWIPLADAAFFVESARPQTQQSIGWDAGRNLTAPDIAEYFWARADGKGAGPNPANHANPNGFLGENRVNYNTLWMYTEAALGNISMFVYMPYLSEDGELTGHAAGFSDIQLGTKTLLFDCELLQIAFEFRVFTPSGDPAHGLGTGHVSLEPGLIVGLKLAQDTYFQGQIAEWIPLGGDPDYEGALLEYHMSLNQVLYRILPDVSLVGTAELNGWSFQTGEFTNPVTGPERASGITYISMGPGLRLFVCDKIDFGVGTAFAVTSQHFADQLFRTEFRWRF
jgi:hypothetical protein